MVVQTQGKSDSQIKEPSHDPSPHISRRKSKYDRALLGRYKLQRTIGTGNFAKVKLAIHLLTGKAVAIKIIDKNELSQSSRKKLSREVNLMKLLDHPHIVKLLEIIQTDRMLYLVLEYASGGEFYEYLATNGRMKEKVAREKFRQILSAVEYCHQKHIIHRDLKLENLLLDSNLNIKLADFGFANKYEEGKKLNTFCGSPPYAAPELFRGKEYEGPEVDVWSLGVILFKMVTGSLPFDGHSLPELRERILRGKYRIPFYMSTECERLLRKMLVLNPKKRFTIQELMKDTWVNLGYENDILAPHVEPKGYSTDRKKVEQLLDIGFGLENIVHSLKNNEFDEITATYFLLDKSDPSLHTESQTSCNESTSDPKATTAVKNKDGKSAPGQMENEVKPKESNDSGAGSSDIQRTMEVSTSGSMAGSNEKSPLESTKEKVITIQRDAILKKWDPKLYMNEERAKYNERTVETGADQLHSTRPLSNTFDGDFQGTSDSVKNGMHRTTSMDATEEADRLRSARLPPINFDRELPENGKDLTSYRVKKCVNRTTSMRVTEGSDRFTNGRVHIISECRPKGQVFLNTGPDDLDNPPDGTVTPVPPNSLETENVVPSSFSRMSSIRRTVHSAYRPDIKSPPEPPGVAGTKGAPLSNPRSNLSKYDADGDELEQPTNVEVRASIKPIGMFKSLTSKFNKRSLPTPPESDQSNDSTRIRNILVHDERTKRSPNGFRDNRPKSELVQKELLQPSERVRPSPQESTAPSQSVRQEHHEPVEKYRSGFMRALSLRFSKRKPSEQTSNSGVNHAIHAPSSISESNSPQLNGHSAMPQTILNAVLKEEANSLGAKSSVLMTENVNHVSNGVLTSKASLETNNEEQIKPKAFRFRFSMKATSKLSPDELVAEVKRVLAKNSFHYVQRNKFLFICTDGQSNCELEICEKHGANERGLRFKKLTGTSVNYKNMHTKILDDLNLN